MLFRDPLPLSSDPVLSNNNFYPKPVYLGPFINTNFKIVINDLREQCSDMLRYDTP
jgi:hypothetical protein